MEVAFSKLAVSQQHLDRAPCANTKQLNGSLINCDSRASLICSKCHLVQVSWFPDSQLLIEEHETHEADLDLSTAPANAKPHIGLYTNWTVILI